MKIELEVPYTRDFKAGYLDTNKESRRVVTLVRYDNSKTSTSYARYLMTCHLKRFLDVDEHVDHIDNDKMNDVIDNLQILSPRDNNLKKNVALGITLKKEITLTCPVCESTFTRPARNIEFKLKRGKSPCCSRKCGGIQSHISKIRN